MTSRPRDSVSVTYVYFCNGAHCCYDVLYIYTAECPDKSGWMPRDQAFLSNLRLEPSLSIHYTFSFICSISCTYVSISAPTPLPSTPSSAKVVVMYDFDFWRDTTHPPFTKSTTTRPAFGSHTPFVTWDKNREHIRFICIPIPFPTPQHHKPPNIWFGAPIKVLLYSALLTAKELLFSPPRPPLIIFWFKNPLPVSPALCPSQIPNSRKKEKKSFISQSPKNSANDLRGHSSTKGKTLFFHLVGELKDI